MGDAVFVFGVFYLTVSDKGSTVFVLLLLFVDSENRLEVYRFLCRSDHITHISPQNHG